MHNQGNGGIGGESMSILDTLITDRTQADVNRIKQIMQKGLPRMTDEEKMYFVKGQLEALDDSTADALVDSNGLTIGCRDGVLPKGSYNYTDLNRVMDAVEYLTGVIRSAGYEIDDPTPITKTHPTTTKTRQKIRLMNAIENAQTLHGGGWRWWTTHTTNTLENEGYKFVLKSTLPATTTNYWLVSAPEKWTGIDIGHKYYWGCQYRCSANATGEFKFSFRMSATGQSNSNTHDFPLEKVEELTQFSEIYELPSTYGAYQFACFIFGSVTVGEEHYFRRPFAYDLTEVFGAGNEPSLEWCQEHIGFDALNIHTILKETIEGTADENRYKVQDIPTVAEMTTYLSNIQRVISRLPLVNVRYDAIPTLPEDMDALLPAEANNIEKILSLVADTIERILTERLTFYSGELFGGEV